MTKEKRTTRPVEIDRVIGRGETVTMDELEARQLRNRRKPRPRTAGYYDARIADAESVAEAQGWVRAKAAFEAELDEAREYAQLKDDVAALQEQMAELREEIDRQTQEQRDAARQRALDDLFEEADRNLFNKVRHAES